jgi:hypothetical protein
VEDLIPILVFIFFIVAPLIERILKGGRQGKQMPPPQQQRERPRPRSPESLPEPKPYQRRSETVSESASETSGEAGTAAEMLPEDLWAILTGEAPPPRSRGEGIPPERTPGPVAMPEEGSWRRAPAEGPRVPYPTGKRRPQRPAREPLPSKQRAPQPRYDEAGIDEELEGIRAEPAGDRPARREEQSLETFRRAIPVEAEPVIVTMETMPERAEVRHTKFHDRLAALSAPSEVQRGPARVNVGLHDPVQLRRAIIVAEVLGKPKGLE